MENQCFIFETPRELFNEVKAALRLLKDKEEITNRNFFFIAAGLNHLREWIAPKYNPRIKKGKVTNPPKFLCEKFYNKIHAECPEFKTINQVCNGLKHCKNKGATASGNSSPVLADWKRMSDVPSLKSGAPQEFSIDGKSAVEVFESVVKFYDEYWFKENPTGIRLE